MEPISVQQYEASRARRMPLAEEIAENLWSVPMPMPGGFLDYSLSVVHLGDGGGVTIIDPGWDSPEARDHLDAFLGRAGRSLADVRAVLVTHAHPDHLGMAPGLRDLSGAELIWSRVEQESMVAPLQGMTANLTRWQVPEAEAETLRRLRPDAAADAPAPPVADRLLEDGEIVDCGSWRLRAVLTPGHTPGHLCFVDEERELLFSGDHILPTVFPGIGLAGAPGENPVADFLGALERLAPYDTFEVVPGHGYRFRGLGERRQETRAHILRRAREVQAASGEPNASIWDIASSLTWTGGWDQVRSGFTLASALMQTEFYLRFAHAGAVPTAAAEA